MKRQRVLIARYGDRGYGSNTQVRLEFLPPTTPAHEQLGAMAPGLGRALM